MVTFQEMIARLTQFWAEQGCLVHQGYDLEVGAGTFNPATFLRCLGPEPYSAVYVEPSRRPADGRYGENPNRVQFYHQMQVILKPSPADIQDLYLKSLEAIGLDLSKHDIRFVHDDWENPTIGAWGLGWEVWADGMEVTQFTYFQAVGGIPVRPVSGELTYGLERLALYIQGVDSFFDLQWNDKIKYGDIYKRSEWEWSHYNFTEANTEMWLRHFEDFEKEAKRLVSDHLPIPAYDFVMKASHAFNILDARGVISVTERTGYIGRIRNLAKMLAECYLKSREEQSYPLLQDKAEVKAPEVPAVSSVCNPDESEDFLLEIGSEELPATFVALGLQNLEAQARHFLKEHNLPFSSIETHGTPRRLAVIIRGLAGGTQAKSVERKGPKVSAAYDSDGNPTKAGAGFLRSIGEAKTTERDGYLFATLEQPGLSTRALLAEKLPNLILKAEFPKKMRWGDLDIEYARPLRWVVALYGTEVIPFAVAGLVSGNTSQGHRQLDPKPFEVEHADTYIETLKKHWVMASIAERKSSIDEQLAKLETEVKGQTLAKERVMAQVLHLVEWPFVTVADFDKKFLHAPKEVLISEMVEHQKYFPVGDSEGNLLPHFFITCNNKPTDLIRKGNQKALFPRLSDGVFLYEEDLKTPLEKFNAQLKKMTYQKELGTMWDKVERLKTVAHELHTHLPLGDLKEAIRAAELSKADLSTQLVGEFPELQGHIGAIYARHHGESAATSSAIEEHWMPRGEKAPLPHTPTGILLSLADKIDTLNSCFAVGLKPTSSSDPYALRRQAIGLIKIVIENKLHLPLHTFIQDKDLITFIISRLRTILVDMDFAKDEIEAVLAKGLTDIYATFQTLQELHSFRQNPAFPAVLEIYTRARKLLASQKESRFPSPSPKEVCEKALLETIEKLKKEEQRPFESLAALQKPMEDFFNEVKVMDDDPKIRGSRLALLNEVEKLCDEQVDFSKLQQD